MLAALEGFELVEAAGPVGAQEAGQGAIGEEFSAGLAARAVVGFVVGVTNALNLIATPWAGLAIATMDGHAFAECSDLLRESRLCLGLQAIDPELERLARGVEKAFPLARIELVSERNGRQLCGMENLVGIGVADAAE